MTACPSCGHDNPETNKFCGECAAPLGALARPVAEERKVITCLFCDLVGFTATSESADPEDVDRMLSAYSAMARAQIEAHGGAVEKFIGDAVVGIFGVPSTHEDDPERAVRSGLQIVEHAGELEALGGAPLRLRVGINTGEAFVRLGVSPGSGERFLAGDAINTASRVQSVAPEMGVGVGLATFAATEAVFDYEELAPESLKGKSEPVRVFHAKAPRAPFGTDLTQTYDTPLIGREVDLALLKRLFDETVTADSVQFVTVVGEPGLGKSRIVAELFAYMNARPEFIRWRQGRCLPYGDGITFWALGEIVKAHAGILDSDAPDVATRKLDTVLPEGSERGWFRQRLLPLLGIEASSSAEREESFTAWRRFLEQIAEDCPTVLVFEDLHWADDAMLSFLEHLGDRAEGVPLLVIGTARPELFERHPDYATGLRNATAINLTPLSDAETARLVSTLLETTVIPAELQQPILDRAEGNPLYVEEFVRLLRSKGLLVQKGSSWELREGADVPFPDSVHALIAARLDTLAPETKSLLGDAATIGKVFWLGAVASMGERELVDAANVLRELSQKKLVRPVRRSSIEGETEFAFRHILVRDVAYAQLPRTSRASRHVAAAVWIASKAAERIEDLAEVLAYHYATALGLARAAGQAEQAARLEALALRFLTLAGERALGLDTTAAQEHLERALALTPPGHPERPYTLARFGEAVMEVGRPVEAAEALEESIASFHAQGDVRAAAEAMGTLGQVLQRLGDPRAWKLPAEALRLLELLPPSPELVSALTEVAAAEALQGRPESGVGAAERALAVAEDLGMDRSARALGFRGLARNGLGDPGGLVDMREAIRLATKAGQGREVVLLHNNLGADLLMFEGPAASLEVMRAGIGFAEARGLAEMGVATTGSTLHILFDTGELDEALEVAASIAERLETGEAVFDLASVHAVRARILALRGQVERMARDLDWIEYTFLEAGVSDDALIGLASSALARAGLGQDEAAAALIEGIEATEGVRDTQAYAIFLPAMVRTAPAIGHLQLAERLVVGFEPRSPYAEHALTAAHAALSELSGDLKTAIDTYADAATRWERLGVVPEHASALLGQGRCLAGLARPTEAAPVLGLARRILERLMAAPALAEADALLQQTTQLTL